ncbi:MAG: hypothetical protein AAF399_10170 [Bacteroidota bacterium]
MFSHLLLMRWKRMFQSKEGWLTLAVWIGGLLISGGIGLGIRGAAGAGAGDEITTQSFWYQIPSWVVLMAGTMVLGQSVFLGAQLPPRIIQRHHPASPLKRVLVHLWIASLSPTHILAWCFWIPLVAIAPQTEWIHLLTVSVWMGAVLAANHVLRISLQRIGWKLGTIPLIGTMLQVVGLATWMLMYWSLPEIGLLVSGASLLWSGYWLIQDESQLEVANKGEALPAQGSTVVDLDWLKWKIMTRNSAGRYWLIGYFVLKGVGVLMFFLPNLTGIELRPTSSAWFLWAAAILAIFVNRFGSRTEWTLWQLQRTRSKWFWLTEYADRFFWIMMAIDGLISWWIIHWMEAPISLGWAYVLLWLLGFWIGIFGSFYLPRRAAIHIGLQLKQKSPISWRLFIPYLFGFNFLGHLLVADPIYRWAALGVLLLLVVGTFIALLTQAQLGHRLQKGLESDPEYRWK